MLNKQTKREVIGDWASSAQNVGSMEAQIGLITERISQIASHLEGNKKDHSSRLGLVKLVGKRRRLMRYLEKNNKASFQSLTKRIKKGS